MPSLGHSLALEATGFAAALVSALGLILVRAGSRRSVPGDVPQELTFEMKRQLNENAALLSSKDLYGMVGVVEDSCRRAIDQTNPQEVEIDPVRSPNVP